MRQTDAEAAQDLLANAGVKLKCLSFAIYDKYHLCLSGVCHYGSNYMYTRMALESRMCSAQL